MNTKATYDIAIIGGGIFGIAHAFAAAKRGLKVAIFERTQKAVGASIRNFGMQWPVGQTAGVNYERALRSQAIWKELAEFGGFWTAPKGSLHLALIDLEVEVMREFAALAPQHGFKVKYLEKAEVASYSPTALNHANIIGALHSETEMTLNSPEAIWNAPLALQAKYGVTLNYNHVVQNVEHPYIHTNQGVYQAERIVICPGSDWEQFYPEAYQGQQFKKCKLQMMRLAVPTADWHLDQALASGMSMCHYDSFSLAPSLPKLRAFYDEQYPELKRWGIHILITENNKREIIIGDSHEYADDQFEPFDRQEINNIILHWVQQYLHLPKVEVLQAWHGIYLKNYGPEVFFRLAPNPNVRIVNGPGGQGMTISMAVGEETLENW